MTDKDAFNRMLERLRNDVGEIIKLVVAERSRDRDWCPWWALARMTFPIAESIGDLIYKSTPSNNLINVLGKDLALINPQYASMPNSLALLYRHSLMHQDELRSLDTQSGTLVWMLSFGMNSEHLKLKQINQDKYPVFRVNIDITQFYEDLVRLLEDKIKNPTPGAWNRYDEWHKLSLIGSEKKAETASREEIEAIVKRLGHSKKPPF